MKILHTSDWHLGKKLYDVKRYEEFDSFLQWLSKYIVENNIECLIVAGDIFDTTTPSNRAKQQYYDFLSRIVMNCTIIILAGNHDSPSFLEAPSELLESFNIHVIGEPNINIEDNVFIIKNKEKEEKAIICAVPFLRDSYIRKSEAGESYEDKEAKTKNGIIEYYKKICEEAKKINNKLPLIATGHLFVSGSQLSETERDLYIGDLGQIQENQFPKEIDYFALGHLHIPQRVKNSNYYYSGSPLPMSFSEATQEKRVLEINIENNILNIKSIKIPVFKRLETIKGNLTHIKERIKKLKDENILLEIIYDSPEIIIDLKEIINDLIEKTNFKVLKIVNNSRRDETLRNSGDLKSLEDLSEEIIFQKCLEVNEIQIEQQQELKDAFNEILMEIRQEDKEVV